MALPVTAITIKQKYYDTSDDLLWNIILKLGGSMTDVKQLFNDTTDDLLYAILTLLDGTVIIGGGGGFPVPEFVNTLSFTSPNAQVFDIGTTPGNNDIAAGVTVNPDDWTDVAVNMSTDPGTVWYVSANNDLTLKIRR